MHFDPCTGLDGLFLMIINYEDPECDTRTLTFTLAFILCSSTYRSNHNQKIITEATSIMRGNR